MTPAPEDRPEPAESELRPVAPAQGDSASPGGAAPRPAGPGRGRGKRSERLVRHFKVDEQLSADDRPAYDALLLDPRQTVDSLRDWLHARGYTTISRHAVHNHRHHFEQDIKEIRKSARIAGQFAALARAQGGAGSLADAGQFRFEQLFLERLFGMGKDERLDGRQWAEFGKAMATLLDNRRTYETLRVEWQEKARAAAAAVEHAASPAGDKSKHKVVNGVEIANTVRRILGVPLPEEPARRVSDVRAEPRSADTDDQARSIEIADEVRRQLGAPPIDAPIGPGRGMDPPSEN